MNQLTLNFEPGLTDRYKSLEDMCLAVVYGYRGGLEGVAGHLDQSPSELSRRLNAHRKEGDTDNRPLRVRDLFGILEETKDYRPIYWLIERFIKDPDARRQEVIDMLSAVLPDIIPLSNEVKKAARK